MRPAPTVCVLSSAAVLLSVTTPAFAIPGGSPLINTPAINFPMTVDDVEGQVPGALPLGWVLDIGSAAVTDANNHSLPGSLSIDLTTGGPDSSASIRKPVGPGVVGFSVAIDPGSIPFGTDASLHIAYITDTFIYQSRYNFSDGSHWVDAGLGFEYDSSVSPADFAGWNVFDYDMKPLFDPALGIFMSPDCDHATHITFWSHGRASPAALDATQIYEVAISLSRNDGLVDPLTIYIDDLKTYDQSIIAIGLPGDGNSDGWVDGLDYLIWASNFGENPADPPGPSGGDYNGDLAVSGIDYLLWAANFGQHAFAAPAPEPGTCALLLMGSLTAAVLRRSRMGENIRVIKT